MKAIILCAALFWVSMSATLAANTSASGLASWYGEDHRGKLMANGKPFNPDELTAASWFYPLGTKVRVSVRCTTGAIRTVVVSITDRGPARRLVRDGRIIDLSHAAYKRLAPPESGLVAVSVRPAW
jgi:rare lipoprotein A